jgi:hypothetical protein
VQTFLAAGILCKLYVTWCPGNPVATTAASEGYYFALQTSVTSSANRQSYASQVATLFKNCPNIIWMIGGDNTPASATNQEAICNDLRTGITAGYNVYAPLFSYDGLDGNDPMADWASTGTGNAWFNLTNVYTDQLLGKPYVYANCKTTYQTYTLPFDFKEGAFEGEHSSLPQFVRSQNWQAALGGAMGWTFGNNPIWLFGSGWQTALNSRGSLDTASLNGFMSTIRWDLLVPDWSNSVVTNGGSFANGTYISSAAASDGRCVVVYTQGGTPVIAMTNLSGTCNAFWVDPTNGHPTFAGRFSNTGTQSFAPPTNVQGDADQVLYLAAS